MTRRAVDAVAAMVVLALAAAYWRLASAIEDSLLSDAVGAGGFPKAIAGLMAGAAILLGLGAFRIPTADNARVEFSFRPVGLLALLVLYVLLFPWLGLPLAIAALIGSAGWYSGLPAGPRLLVVAVLAGLLFWLAFVKVMGVPFPVLPRWPA